MLVRAYVHADDEKFSVLYIAVAVLEVDAACADAFDFRAEKFNSRLLFFVDEIIVICFFVLRGNLNAARLSSNGAPPLLHNARVIIHYFIHIVKAFFVEGEKSGCGKNNFS